MGENCYYHPITIPSEPFLVSLHNNVVIAANVSFITHDITCGMFNHSQKYGEGYQVYYGTIEIFDNVFIGAKSIILPNIKIGSDVIIAAGSIVTKDVLAGSIVAGVPARIIGKTENYAKKMREYSEKCPDLLTKESISEYLWR